MQRALEVPLKSKWGAKEFPYKRFLKCYSCGASIVGEEKIRNYKNGKQQKFTYYHCSRQVKLDCPEPFVRVEVIEKELVKLSNKLITDLTELEPGLNGAIDKFTRMMRAANKSYSKKNLIVGYVKYVLQEGTEFEKTRLVRNLHINLALHERRLLVNS